MTEIFTEETLSGRPVELMSSLDIIPDTYITENDIQRDVSLRRGDCVLVDEIKNGRKTGKKVLIIIAGFTFHREGYPNLIIFFGEPEEIVKRRKFVVVGQAYTDDFEKKAVKIKIPQNNFYSCKEI